MEWLYEDDAYAEITRSSERVSMRMGNARWSEHYESLARRFGVDTLVVDDESIPEDGSLGFIRELPCITTLSFTFWEAVDLSALEGMPNLRHLHLNCYMAESRHPVDFATLPNLEECHITLCPEYLSITRCTSLRVLQLSSGRDVQDVDLSRLENLRELRFWDCREVRSFELRPDVELLALELTTCPELAVDWERIGRDLRYLWLRGRLSFPTDEIAHASKLQVLMMNGRDAEPALEFLRDMPELRAVEFFGPKAPEADKEVVRSINAAGGYGRTLEPKLRG